MKTATAILLRRRAAGAKARARGEALELMALAYLRSAGCLVERIATPTVVRGGKALHTAKVLADIVGLAQGGQGLLCECKNVGGRPRPSDFRPHQRKALLDWKAKGGVALVAYIENGQLIVSDVRQVLEK
jgi:hypothetical protein